MTRAQEILRVLGDHLGASAQVRNVFGEAVRAENRTVIPVARIGYGMGAGAGGVDEPGDAVAGKGGGGGGGGVGALPVGVIEITADGTRFLPVSGTRRLLAALSTGVLLGYVFGRLGRRK